MASAIVQCVLCGIPSPSLKLYISHLRTVHGKDPNFNVMCNINECREVFRAFSAFNSHVYRHHRVAVGLEKPATVCDDAQANDSSVVDTDLPELGCLEMDSQNLICSEEHPAIELHKVGGSPSTCTRSQQELLGHHAAVFLLNLREGHQVSQVAIRDVIAGCRRLYGQVFSDSSAHIQEILKNNHVNVDMIPGLCEAPPDPFIGIDTDYLYEKFCREHLGFLVSNIAIAYYNSWIVL